MRTTRAAPDPDAADRAWCFPPPGTTMPPPRWPRWPPARRPVDAGNCRRILDQADRRAGPPPGIEVPLAERLHALLLTRRGAPGAAVWRGEAGPASFTLNLAAFYDPEPRF